MINSIRKFFKTNRTDVSYEVEIALSNYWMKYDEGKSIGEKGSEKGFIIFDSENLDGARITLEKK